MEYVNAKYIANPIIGGHCGISVMKNGADVVVPLEPDNTDYQNIMTLVDEGKLVIQPADEVTS